MAVTPRLTAADVKAALRARHGCPLDRPGKGRWVCIEEALNGITNTSGGIDLLTLGAWASAKEPWLVRAGDGRAFGSCNGEWVAGTRYPIVAYEVKVSRSDFRRELYGYEPKSGTRTRGSAPWPAKAERALGLSHYFLFATPAGLLKPDEYARRERPEDGGLWLPPEAGLIEVTPGGRVHTLVKAPARPLEHPMTRAELHELMRRLAGWSWRQGVAA